jgi:peptide/nickel transport system permease protein
MTSFLIRRLGLGVLTLVMITVLVYALIRAMPGSPLTVAEGANLKVQISEEEDRAFRAQFGLDGPWHQGYVFWLRNLLKGDLGFSFVAKRSVNQVILERIGPTLLLSSASLFFAYLISIPLGLWATHRAGKWDERATGIFLYILYSFPGFIAALMLQIFVAVKLDWLPLNGMSSSDTEGMSSWQKLIDILKHAILPTIVYTYGSLAYYSRFIRANLQEVVRQDYIRTARAKGLSEYAVLVKHAFRNTLIPFATKVGLSLPELMGGSVIVERIFSWPGLGQLYYSSIQARDYPVIMAQTLIFAVLTLAGQLLADVLYAIVDPRVRISDAET